MNPPSPISQGQPQSPSDHRPQSPTSKYPQSPGGSYQQPKSPYGYVQPSSPGYMMIDAADANIQRIVHAGGCPVKYLKDYYDIAGLYAKTAPDQPQPLAQNLHYGKVEKHYEPAVKRTCKSHSDSENSSTGDESSSDETPSAGKQPEKVASGEKEEASSYKSKVRELKPSAQPRVDENEELEKILNGLLHSGIDAVPTAADLPPGLPRDIPEDSDNLDPNQLMAYASADTKLIILWTKKIPGFSSLPMNLQRALIIESVLDLSILRLSFRSLEAADGFVHFTDRIKMKLEVIHRHGWNLGVVNGTAHFTYRLQALELDYMEFIILSVMTLIASEGQCLDDYESKLLLSMQYKYLEVLKYYHLRYTPWRQNRYCKLLLKLPTLHKVAEDAKASLVDFKDKGKVQLSSLVEEVLRMKEEPDITGQLPSKK